MPQYFSSAPLDYGARYIYEGQTNAAAAIANGISSGAGSIAGGIHKYRDQKRDDAKIAADYAQREKMKNMQAAIDEQSRRNASERRIIEDAAQYGVAPTVGQDGKVNLMATSAATLDAKDRHDRVRANAGMQDQYNFNLKTKADALGLGGQPAPARTPLPAAGAIFGSMNTEMPSAGAGPLLSRPRPDALQAKSPLMGLQTPAMDGMGLNRQETQPVPESLAQRVRQEQVAQDLKERTAGRIASSQGNYEATAHVAFPDGGIPRDASGNITPEGMRKIDAATDQREQLRTRNATMSTARQMVTGENPGIKPGDPGFDAKVARKAQYLTAPAAIKSAMLNADELVKSGLLNPDDDLGYTKEVNRLASYGGNVPAISNEQRESLAGWNALQQNQQVLLKKIDDFNAANPDKSFDQYVGPIDNRTLKINLAINGNADPKAKEAGRILQFYQDMLNQKVKDMSGGAVTVSEMLRNMLAAGDPESANFVNSMRGWADSTATNYQSRLNALRSYRVPDSLSTVNGKSPGDWVGSWQGDAQAATAAPVNAAPAAPAQSPSLPSGWTFKK